MAKSKYVGYTPSGARAFGTSNEKDAIKKGQEYADKFRTHVKVVYTLSGGHGYSGAYEKVISQHTPADRGDGMYGSSYKPTGFASLRRGNPSVEDMTSEWHGRGSQNETDIEEIESYEEDLAELADLEELGLLASNIKDEWNISFKRDRPKLACDANGHNLEIIGGDQSLDVKGFREVGKNGKRVVPLGWLVRIVYETDKHHLEGSNGYPESYEHYFGEDYYKKKFAGIDDYDTPDEWWEAAKGTGVVKKAVNGGIIPMLVYNIEDDKLMIVGGCYEVKDVGIRN